MKLVIAALLGVLVGYELTLHFYGSLPTVPGAIDWTVKPVQDTASYPGYVTVHCPTNWTLVMEDGKCHENFALAYAPYQKGMKP